MSRSRAFPKSHGNAHHPRRAGARARFGWISLAAEIYTRVRSSKRTLDTEVAATLRAHSLSEEDTGLALDTAYGMLRKSGFLERCARLLPFPPSHEAKVALYLLWTQSAVSLPLGQNEERAAQRAIEAALQELAEQNPAQSLADQSPVPRWLCEKWLQEKGETQARRLCEAFAAEAPLTLRVNRLRTTRDELLANLDAAGIPAHFAKYAPDGLHVEKRVPLTQTRWFADGHFERQDEGSQLLSLLCEAKPGMRVVDVCAGAGGKSLHLAAQMENKGTLYAADVHGSRLRALKARAKRAGVWNLQICDLGQQREALTSLHKKADVLLVDAPCSGSGTLRRAPDIGWRLGAKSIPRLVDTQLAILEQHHALVRPGGRLVYATCSVLDEEGPYVIEQFLARHPEFEQMTPQSVLAAQGIELADGPYLQLRPDLHDCDGFFAAVLRRPISGGVAPAILER